MGLTARIAITITLTAATTAAVLLLNGDTYHAALGIIATCMTANWAIDLFDN